MRAMITKILEAEGFDAERAQELATQMAAEVDKKMAAKK